MASDIAALLSEALDLCVRAKRLEAQEALVAESARPGMPRSGTVPLWAWDQYERDLNDWQSRAQAALSNPHPHVPRPVPPSTRILEEGSIFSVSGAVTWRDKS